MKTTARFLACMLLACLGGAALPALADTYPSKPIRLIVPYAAGGGTDTVARLLGQKLSASMGQQVIVENRPGASTQLGTSAVVTAAPDGYTLLMGTANLATNVPLFAKLPYDAQKDLMPVSLVTKVPVYLFVNESSPIKDVATLVSRSKATPGGLSYGTAGNGSIPHLAGEMFNTATKSGLVHVPYKGSSEAATALLGGQVALAFDNLPPMNAYVKAGRVKPVAIALPARSALLPNVPTLAELGVPMEAYSWWGVMAPAGTPAPVVERLNKEILAALQLPDVKERFMQQGIEPVGSSPADFGKHIRAETEKWSRIVRDANIKPE